MPDDPSIPDDAVVWRQIVPLQIVTGEDGVGALPSTGAFDDSSDGDPMSAILASKGRDPKSAVPKRYPDAGVVAFTAKFLRSLGLELERAPEPDEPDHILVRGKKTGSVKKKLKKSAEWVVVGKKQTE